MHAFLGRRNGRVRLQVRAIDMDVELQRGSSNDQWWRGTAIE